jgi:hypothetical protein
MGMMNLTASKLRDYQQGGEGFLLWASENLHIFDRPNRRWKPFEPWEIQVQTAKDALQIEEDGRFKYRFVVFCWPRGESKSFMVCAITIWRFCCFPRERILLGANSRDQVEFVHFNVIKEHILNSPELREFVGEDNVMEKGIVLKREKERGPRSQKDVFSKDVISPISTAHGIMSNITVCTFSEMHKMKNETFYTELAGSIRAIRNGMALVDSTVAPKGHILERMFRTSQRDEDPLLYFSHYEDKHYNPDMTEAELLSYSKQLLPSEFNRHFRNRWEDASYGMFTKVQIEALDILGYGEKLEKGVDVIKQTANNIGESDAKGKRYILPPGGLALLPKVDGENGDSGVDNNDGDGPSPTWL